MERVVDPTADLRKQHEALLKASREALAKDRERKEAFESLVKHPGWLLLRSLLNTMVEERSGEVLAPARSIDGAIALEHVKGTMNGLILARDLPHLIMETTPAAQLEDEDDETP